MITSPVTHSLCGEVDYDVFFEGQQIDTSSMPLSYDTTTRTFEMYSEQMALLGTRSIAIQGYFRDYMHIKSAPPDLETTIEILDPCLRPASITNPGQKSLLVYDYNQQGARLAVAPLDVDPIVCPVTYFCVSIIGVTMSIDCNDSSVVSVNSQTGVFSFMSHDMEKYLPGEYEVTLKGSAGTEVLVHTEFTFTMRLEDPCPTSKLSNL